LLLQNKKKNFITVLFPVLAFMFNLRLHKFYVMKQLLIAGLLIVGIFGANAQKSTINYSVEHGKSLAFLFGRQQNAERASKTTAVVTNRVTAQSTHDSLWGPIQDSVLLSYGTNRGSTYDFNTMIYPYNYTYNKMPMFNYEGVFSTPQVLSDTYQHWTIDPVTLLYGFFEATYSIYNTNNNLTQFQEVYNDSITYTNTSSLNIFNANHQIAQSHTTNRIAGIADSEFKQYFAYDGFNKLIADSTYEYHAGAWHLAAKTYYTYNASNDISRIDCYGNVADTTFASVLQEQLQYQNVYDGAHRLLYVTTNINNGTALAPSARDTFGYTGSHPFHTSWRSYQYDNINLYWAPMFNMTKTLNTFGFPDTVTVRGFDSLLNAWVPQSFETVTYDTANNPLSLSEYDYFFTAYPSIPNTTTYYYYQPYTNTTAAPSLAVNTSVKIYPNPTSGNIHIETPENVSGLVITVYNVAGLAVIRTNMSAATLSNQIELGNLAPGIYRVAVCSPDGQIVTQQQLVKQ
jgi:Secretion system C-terminal sorting domain